MRHHLQLQPRRQALSWGPWVLRLFLDIVGAALGSPQRAALGRPQGAPLAGLNRTAVHKEEEELEH